MTAERFGLSCAISTPFDAKGAIDLQRFIAHARKCRADGVDRLTLFGTTGEGFSVDLDERARTIAAFKSAGFDMRREVGIGIMASAAGDAAAQCRQALDADCHHLLLAPPYYAKNLSDDGIFGWHADLFAMLGKKARDVILYNLPSMTAVPLSIDVVGRLKAAFPGIVTGVKDSSGNLDNSNALVRTHGDLAILIGDERHLAGIVRQGGQGAICGMANLEPARMRKVAYEGKDDPVINKLVDTVVSYPVLAAIKALIAHRTNDAGWAKMRAPLDTLDAKRAKDLAAKCDAITG